MKIKNWSKFQHFKDRRPPWVKLYRDLLDDMEWHQLDPLASKVLVTLWLLASEDDEQSGKLPSIKTIAWRLRMSETDVKACISKLSHWLDHDDIIAISEQHQSDTPETETEVETKKEEERETPRKRSAPPAVACPADVDQQAWADWLIVRKKKGAPLTQTARDLMTKEVSKAGWPIDKAIKECCLRSWVSFKADWIMPDERQGAGRQPAETAYQRSMRERMQQAAPEFARRDPSKPMENVIEFFATEVKTQQLEIGHEPTPSMD
jgi:hypothetical protein